MVSPKNIARSDLMKLKVSSQKYSQWAPKELIRTLGNTISLFCTLVAGITAHSVSC